MWESGFDWLFSKNPNFYLFSLPFHSYIHDEDVDVEIW